MRRKLKQAHLKVIKGKGQMAKGGLFKWEKKPSHLLLICLAVFLLLQILIGWVWGAVKPNPVNTVLADRDIINLSFPTEGLVTFEEEVIFATRPGFIYYYVEEGQRVPVGKELARITEIALKNIEEKEKDKGVLEYYQSFRQWFLEDNSEEYAYFFPLSEEVVVNAPLAGLVSFKLDGFETFGPNTHFPYPVDEELTINEQRRESGEKVHRFMPLLRIINNYYWYYSTVLSPFEAELIGDRTHVELYFSFVPGKPVLGQKVEAREKADGGGLEITWRIDRYLENFYNVRRCSAEIVYDNLEGMVVPRSSLLEKNGVWGVYVLEGGLVSFKEVAILAEREEELLVENLDLHQRVVIRPEDVEEGQRFFW